MQKTINYLCDLLKGKWNGIVCMLKFGERKGKERERKRKE